MPRRMFFLAGSVGLCVLAGSDATSGARRGVSPPNGLPIIGGSWIGKIPFKSFDLSGGSGPGFDAGVCDLGLIIGQTGADLAVTVTISCPDDPVPMVIPMAGKIGNGHLWLVGSTIPVEGTSSEEVVISASVAANGTKMKGMGFAVEGGGSNVTDFKFSGRLLPPTIK